MTAPDPVERAAALDALVGVVEERTELRLTGQPDGGYPPYDFTFRSDRGDAGALAEIVRVLRHTSRWADVRVQRRHVRVETRATDWVDVDPTETTRAGDP